jgi:hypothetical protein
MEESLLPKPAEKILTDEELVLERIKEMTVKMDEYYANKDRLSVTRFSDEPKEWYDTRRHWIKKLEKESKKYGKGL